jgi:hypothetical protein
VGNVTWKVVTRRLRVSIAASVLPMFLSPSNNSSLPQSITPKRSTASLRAANGTSHATHSLAHELAVALMPEPSEGSKLLVEEFGIEYDEGAEGIDQDHPTQPVDDTTSFSVEQHARPSDSSLGPPVNGDLVLGGPASSQKQPNQDAMDLLSRDLVSTDKFLSHLRQLDIDSGASVAQQPSLEKIASDVIRRINETTRDREGQVRSLLEYEREFRRIAAEVGGGEALGELEELEDLEDLSEKPSSASPKAERRQLSIVEEEPSHLSNDWEMDPDQNHLGDDDHETEPNPLSPVKDAFPPPPPMNGFPTPAKTIPQLTDLRTFTSSLVTSLTTISEQAQVNGAATTEAGRKIRALKNKLGGWRADWDSAERSRMKIERWEAGLADRETVSLPTHVRREDGRQMVAEHLAAFEQALTEAGRKTQAIMAAS